MINMIIEMIVLLIQLLIKNIQLGLLVMRRIIIEKIIAPIIELATFGFIRLVRIEDNE